MKFVDQQNLYSITLNSDSQNFWFSGSVIESRFYWSANFPRLDPDWSNIDSDTNVKGAVAHLKKMAELEK